MNEHVFFLVAAFLLVDGNDEFVDQGKVLDASDEEFEIIEWPPGPFCNITPGASCSTPQSKKQL